MKLEEVKRIACIGGGVIGHSWAGVFAQKGFEVRLMDASRETLDVVPDRIRATYEIFIRKGLMTSDDLETALSRIQRGTDLAWAVEEADYCLESVPEKVDLKKEVFARMDRHAPKRAVLASSTSGQSITEISKATARPDRCIIVHPANPPHIIPAVEVVRGEKTSDETLNLSLELLHKIGRRTYVCRKEVPGFIFNRLQCAVFREAMSLVQKGAATVEDIDTAVNSALGVRYSLLGPFETFNLTAFGGIEVFFKNYSGFLKQIWSDLDDMKEVPPDLAEAAVAGVKAELKGRSQEEIIKWRDEKLLEVLEVRGMI